VLDVGAINVLKLGEQLLKGRCHGRIMA